MTKARDEGFSLVEVLMGVVLLGLAAASVLPALLGSVRGSGLQDRFAGARRWVVSASDYRGLVKPPARRLRDAEHVSECTAFERADAPPRRLVEQPADDHRHHLLERHGVLADVQRVGIIGAEAAADLIAGGRPHRSHRGDPRRGEV